MSIEQLSENISGITVYGSFTLQVEPDSASLSFAVNRTAQHPRESFQQVREGASKVRAFLTQAGQTDVRLSRVNLSESSRFVNGEKKFLGYTATVSFNLILKDLDRMEEILVGIVDAGSDEIKSVGFQTSRLKEIRAEARRGAVDAAREKAENYCKAAGVELGPLVQLEDINPDDVNASLSMHRGARLRTPPMSIESGAFDAGNIEVDGAVRITYELKR